MKKTALLLILTMIISLIPALSVGAAGEEYYLKGIYEGATVVIQQEPTRTVTLVDIANTNAISEAATNVSKVVFTFNGVETEDTGAPFSYTMGFSAIGTQTIKYDVYKTGNETDTPDESKTITFNVVAGTKNAESFTQDFEGTFADDAAAAASIITSYDPERAAIKKVDLNGRNVLEIDPIGSRTTDVIFKSDNATAGHKVCYYEFDMQTLYSYASYFRVIGSANDTLFSTQSGTRGIDKDTGYYIFTRGTWRKIGVVLDYNYQDGGAPTATVYIDGKEYKRVPLTNVAGSTNPVFGIRVDNLGDNIYIDNFKYAVYDTVPTPTFTGASIVGGEDKPVLETLSQIRFTGSSTYLDGQNVANFVTVSQRANGTSDDFVAATVDYSVAIDGADIVVTFADDLSTGTTYKVSISGIQDEYLMTYADYDFTFRTLNQGENPLPEITLTSPVADERYYPNESAITFSADAFDTLGGSITKVEFFVDGQLIGEGTNTEGDTYTYEWVPDDSIDKSEPVVITAKATDNGGDSSETLPVNIVIWSKQLPEVAITSPAQDTVYCASIGGVILEVKPTIEFTAEDADGTINDINIWLDGDCIESLEDPAATSYTFTDAITDLGEHTIIVEVYDNDGQAVRDDVTVIVKDTGKSGYLLNEDYAATDLLSKWYNKGTATLSNGSLTGSEDIKGVIISATDATANTAERRIDENLTETSFATDVKVAFNNTSAKRVVMLNSTELATFTAGGKITFDDAEVGTYMSGVVYNVSAVIDAEKDKMYVLVNGTKIGEKAVTFTIDPFIKISHEGVGETAIISAKVSRLGDAVEPTVVIDGNEITVSFPAGVDEATLDGNVLVVSVETGKAVSLIYADGVFTINEVLKYTESYKVVVMPDVRDINGSGYSGTFEAPLTVSAPSVAVAEVSGSVAGNTATLSVDFVGAAESKVVTLVCAAYKNNKMVAYGTYEFNTDTELQNYALTLTGTIEAGSVIEAFVVDGELNSVTDKILVVE